MRMKKKLLFGLVILILAVPAAAQEATKYSEKTFTVGEKAFLHVKTVAGNITVVGWEKDGQILVQYRISGENVKPVFEQSGDEVFIKEQHEERGFFGSSCGSVHFKVFVPSSAMVEVKSVSGEMRLDKLANSVEAKTVSGGIVFTLAGTGDVEVTTVSGGIKGRIEKMFNTSLEAKCISGDIDLEFPGGADARVRARSISGGIESKLKLEDLESKKGYGSASITGRIGAGTGKITLTTISGGITIR